MPQLPEIDGIKSLGNKVRNARKAKGLTTEELANIAELEISQINRVELGKTNARLSTILIIARALGISPRELFD